MNPIDALQIASGPSEPTLTPAQKRFNTLVRQIDKARQQLSLWQESLSAYREAHAQGVRPLQQKLLAERRTWALALDALTQQRGWTKTELGILKDLICEAASILLSQNSDDPALKSVYERHAETDFETQQQEMAWVMKDLAEAMTGLDLGEDDGIHSEKDLLKRMQQRADEQAEVDAARQAEQAAAAPPRQRAAQQRREAEAQQATRSVRDIYRRLASALHPDRETDDQLREGKTALMQRVNQAYAANDLLMLLELQLEIEQIDQARIAQASAQQLKHYNKVLGEQLAELKAEIVDVEMGFMLEFGPPPGKKVDPRTLGRSLEQQKQRLHAELVIVQQELSLLDDRQATKRWLKVQQRLMREEAFDFPFPF